MVYHRSSNEGSFSSFRQGLMLMQTASSMAGRDVQQTATGGHHNRRGGGVSGTSTVCRAEYVVLARQNAAAAGSSPTPTGLMTAAAIEK